MAFRENSVRISDCRASSLLRTVPRCQAYSHCVSFKNIYRSDAAKSQVKDFQRLKLN